MTEVSNTTQVIDSEFKYLYEVPSHLVAHIPDAHPRAPHLTACGSYRPCEPNSCPMGTGCKFVHADVDYTLLEGHPVHVNYIWRHESHCTYERRPPGDVLEVLMPNNKKPVDRIPSELVLATQAVLPRRRTRVKPLSHCAHYYFNGLCHRGVACNFVHAVTVNPNVEGDLPRIFCRSHRRQQSGGSKGSTKASIKSAGSNAPASIAVGTPLGFATMINKQALSMGSSDATFHNGVDGSEKLGLSGSITRHYEGGTSECNTHTDGAVSRRPRVYRHNPYGL
uniref:Uncharacterized protein TCIL3000_10_10890 n=1 Tax=Trypanosoma congolense (strain IL3000) TaxID=1068625 RepID=G0UY43_TRYCI|nr:unnamed protein product [Trypanosoma congolense IL3000]